MTCYHVGMEMPKLTVVASCGKFIVESNKSIPDPRHANVTKVLLLTSGGYLREAGDTWKTEHNARLAVERFERRWRNGECRHRVFTIAALAHLDE